MNQQNSNIKQFPPITKQRALQIAARALKSQDGQFECHSRKPESCRIYGITPIDPCWYVYVPWYDGLIALRSSRVMVISRVNGKILYDGSAGDEG